LNAKTHASKENIDMIANNVQYLEAALQEKVRAVGVGSLLT
jgi:hypothetical protein